MLIQGLVEGMNPNCPICRKTGHCIKYAKVGADTGDEVPNEDIVKGYQLEGPVHRGDEGGARERRAGVHADD